MTQPVVEDRYDDLSLVGLAVGTITGVALVAAFVGTFGYMVMRTLGRALFG